MNQKGQPEQWGSNLLGQPALNAKEFLANSSQFNPIKPEASFFSQKNLGGVPEGALKISLEEALERMKTEAPIPKLEIFFFDQDNDSHWYLIPSSKRELWNELSQLDLDVDENYQRWSESGLEDYMTGGGISDIDFIPVNK